MIQGLVEELLRFIVGEKFRKPMFPHLYAPRMTPAHDELPESLSNMMKLALRINPVKCEKCKRKLSFEELNAGKCDKCGNEL